MSGIPNEIPEYGDAKLKPRQNPEFAPGADFGTEDYFVWSRCDGTVSLHDIILMVGFGTSRSIEILAKLRNLGAVLLPGETRAPASLGSKSTSAAPTSTRAAGSGRTRAEHPAAGASSNPPPGGTDASASQAAAKISLPLSDPSTEEAAALQADCALDDAARVRLLLFRRRLDTSNLFELLEIEAEADKRTVKRAYFRLSKEFHPDRYFGKELGPFTDWVDEVFKAVTDAFKVLGDNKKRAAYEASLRGEAQQPQTREEHAQSLFQSGCDSELQGDPAQALKLFAAAIRMDAQPRYLRRAAMCAAQSRELSLAEEYAKKAAHLCDRDASYLRVLADVYRAGMQLDKAQEVLERALALDTENDILFGEIQSDLATVKEQIAEKLAAEEGN